MSYKLLLADDSITIQRVIELTFADEDVQLTAVGDGRAAIERMEADPPDIVLADVGMPEKDGYEVAAYIKNSPRLAHIPVLLLTGAFEPVDEERARAVGCDGVLAKPFEPQMVISRVRELLAGAARRASGPRGVLPPATAAAVHTPATTAPAVPGVQPQLSVIDALSDPLTTSVGETPVEWDAGILTVFDAPAPVDPMPPEGSEQDRIPVTEPALDSTLRLRRRQTFVLAESGAPPAAPPLAPEPVRHAALDDYFARLDAAFTNLQSAPPAPPPPAPEEPDWRRLAPDTEPLDLGVLDEFLTEEPQPARPDVQPLFKRGDPQPVQADAGANDYGRQAIAEAFSALLAAERGEADSGQLSSWIAPPPPPAVDVDDLVDRVTRLVLERMSDRAVRDTVTDIVSRVAERLVREEIDRIKASVT